MTKSFNTKIVFRRSLSNQEQFAFWNGALKSIKQVSVSGTTEFENNMDWRIDYSDSNVDEFEAKRRFSDFLYSQRNLIQDFSFYESQAA